MATSGSFKGATVNGPNWSYFNWQLVSQDVAGNFSVISWQFGWFFSGSVTCRDLTTGVVNINGVNVYNVANVHVFNSGHSHAALEVASGQVTIPHNADGTKSFFAEGNLIGFSARQSYGGDTFDLPAIPRQPGAPGTPTISNLAATSATISWTPPADVGAGLTQRQVQVATNPTFAAPLVDDTAAWGTSYAASGLAKGTQYWARVRAGSSAGFGPYTAAVPFTTLTTVPGPAGTPAISSITPTSAVVSWTPPADDGGLPGGLLYEVQRATNAAFTSGVVTSGVAASPQTLTGLIGATPYWVRVRATNSNGPGDWSAAAQFTAAAQVYVGNGSSWVPCQVFVGNGTAWVPANVAVGNGTAWS